MLDKKTELMLQVASSLSAEDLHELRGSAATVHEVVSPPDDPPAAADVQSESDEDAPNADDDATRGQRERARTRESKVATACLGQPRDPHEWWAVGTELVGQIGSEQFTATVVENDQVKSGRSVLINSGAARDKLCLTPTRAAIEATEAYRQAKGMGRGGGITNGWSFWKPKS